MVFEERLIRIRDAFVTFEIKFSMADKDLQGSSRKLSLRCFESLSQIDKVGLYSTGSRILLLSPNKKRNLGVNSTRKVESGFPSPYIYSTDSPRNIHSVSRPRNRAITRVTHRSLRRGGWNPQGVTHAYLSNLAVYGARQSSQFPIGGRVFLLRFHIASLTNPKFTFTNFSHEARDFSLLSSSLLINKLSLEESH